MFASDCAAEAPSISVIVPARNASATLAQCLAPLLDQSTGDDEIIVVDDCSTDDTYEVASRPGVQVVRLLRHSGAGAARNRGAQMARGPILFFIDADVVLAPGGMARVRAIMARAEVYAVIGSYDDDPAAPSLVSRFKNLAHHHFHQRSGSDATSFWTACGVIRRDIFFSVQGFPHKPLEDVELGYRLAARGIPIVLDPGLQVKHLKKWTLASLIRTDVMGRAIPWTMLWLEHGRLPRNLNFSADQRFAAIVAAAMPIASAAALLSFEARMFVAALAAVALWINRRLYRLLLEKGGLRLALCGFFLQQLYYLYSLFGLAAGVTIHYALIPSRRLKASGPR